MKNVILELFDQQRQLNGRLIEMQKINEEKEQSKATPCSPAGLTS